MWLVQLVVLALSICPLFDAAPVQTALSVGTSRMPHVPHCAQWQEVTDHVAWHAQMCWAKENSV
jgi:hypothetical protein